jgi:hypothetical protein
MHTLLSDLCEWPAPNKNNRPNKKWKKENSEISVGFMHNVRFFGSEQLRRQRSLEGLKFSCWTDGEVGLEIF